MMTHSIRTRAQRNIALMLLVLNPSIARAITTQVASSKGVASLAFGPASCGTPSGIGKDKQSIAACRAPSAEEIRAVQRQAALNAIERYATESGEAGLRNFERIRTVVSDRLEDYVLSIMELTRNTDTTTRTVIVTVRADISEARLRNTMQASSPNTTPAAQKNMLAVFVVAREQSTIQRFIAEESVVRRTTSDSSKAATRDSSGRSQESSSVRAGRVEVSDSVASADRKTTSASAVLTLSSAGSAIERADRIGYTVAPAQDLDAVLGGLLTAAGYETVDAAFLEDDVEVGLTVAVRQDFGTGDDLKPATLRRIAKASQKNEVRMALVGTVDLGLAAADPVSGNIMVYAKVSAKIYDVSSRLPRTIVNVAPAQFAGLGPNASVAKVNALKAAGEAIAREVLAQLNLREIR